MPQFFFQFQIPWKTHDFGPNWCSQRKPQGPLLKLHEHKFTHHQKKCPLFKWFPLIIDVKNAGFPWCWKHELLYVCAAVSRLNAGIWWKSFPLAFGQNTYSSTKWHEPRIFWGIFIESWERNNNKVPSIPASGQSVHMGITTKYIEVGEGNHYLPQEFRN